MLEVPVSVDRAGGDIHPYGNPHIQLDPRNIARVAEVLAARLIEVDAAGRAHYQSRLQDFETRWETAVTGWEARGAALSGMGVVVHHRSWVYLEQWLGLDELGSLEPKPGIDPSASYLAELLAGLEGEDLTADHPLRLSERPRLEMAGEPGRRAGCRGAADSRRGAGRR